MSKILESATTRADDDSWTFQCPGVDSSPCGDPSTGQPFVSTGWPTKTIAQARGSEHLDEHKGVAPTSSLEEFRAKHGLAPHSNGTHAVRIEDLP